MTSNTLAGRTQAIEQNKIFFNQVLNNLGFPNGVDQIIKGFKENPIHEWLQYGSVWEDEIGIKWINPFSSKGAMYNHFFDPLYDLGYYEIEDGQINEIGESLIDRMNDSVPDSLGWQQNHNEWAYQMARKLYYSALTGNSHDAYNYWFMRDKALNMFTGKENMNHTEREQFFAWTFQALGHIAHLIQDASVPAHTRNDLHADKKVSWMPFLPNKEPFEEWTVKNYEKQSMNYNGSGSNSWDLWKSYTNIPAQNAFIDTYPHTQGSTTPDPIVKTDDLNQGLAQYSYANFLSSDSVYMDNPLGHDDLHDLDSLGFSDLGDVINKEEIQIDNRMYSYFYVKNKTTGVNHFALCGLSWSIKQMVASEGHAAVTGLLYTVNDDLVNQDYASKLIPRAVGYSAGFLEYFFRGKIELTNIDFEIGNAAYNSVSLSALNITDNNEEMTGGSISLVIRYKTFGQEEFIYKVKEHNADAIPRDIPLELSFNIGEFDIPNTVPYMDFFIVFKGQLGNETDAVAVGYYSVLSTLFEEGWDNGLIGNHPWAHQSYHDPGQGIAVNEISAGILNKENRRYAGNEDPCYNESFVSLIDAENPNGILITPNATVQFKIPEMSFAGAPSVCPFQALILIFNNGLRIHYSQEGQQHYWTPETAHYTFNPDLINIDNIYNSFQSQGIAITEPLYLKKIDFLQQLYDLDEPSASEHIQKMKIDFIKIIGSKP